MARFLYKDRRNVPTVDPQELCQPHYERQKSRYTTSVFVNKDVF